MITSKDLIAMLNEGEKEAFEYAQELNEYVFIDDVDEIVRIKALGYIFASALLEAEISNCEIVNYLERIRTSILLGRMHRRDRELR